MLQNGSVSSTSQVNAANTTKSNLQLPKKVGELSDGKIARYAGAQQKVQSTKINQKNTSKVQRPQS